MRASALAFLATGGLLPLAFTALAPASAGRTHRAASGTLCESQEDGMPAPTLSGLDTSGAELDWAQFRGRVTILYFHTERTSNAHAALQSLAESLGRTRELEERATVLFIVDDTKAGEVARAALSASGLAVRVGLDTERSLVTRYHVIAFPTAYVVDGNGKIVASIRGHSTFLGFQITTACRYAADLIDKKEFEELRQGKYTGYSVEGKRTSLKYRMSLRLVETGRFRDALPGLEELATGPEPQPELLRLLVHLCIRTARIAEANHWIEQLSALVPNDPALALFRIRIDLAAGDPSSARTRLAGLRNTGPHVDRVRAELLAGEDRWEEAAGLYRDALDCLLFLPR